VKPSIRIRLLLVLSVVAGASYSFGILSCRYNWVPYSYKETVYRVIRSWVGRPIAPDPTEPSSDVSGRRPVSCSDSVPANRDAVILILGQSNGANFGEGLLDPNNTSILNLNYLDGKCYVAKDPLLGGAGSEGSLWTRLGSELLSQSAFDRVIFVPVAVGGSWIAQWVPGGAYHGRLSAAITATKSAGLHLTHVLWMQGEADVTLGTSAKQYEASFRELAASIRASGISAPIFVSVQTICGNSGSPSLRSLQRELPRKVPLVAAGPNLDELSDVLRYRRDGCHFNEFGLREGALLWKNALETYRLTTQ
jgi:hypothetical protein